MHFFADKIPLLDHLPVDPVQDKPVSDQTPVAFHTITDKGNSAAVDLIKINLNIKHLCVIQKGSTCQTMNLSSK